MIVFIDNFDSFTYNLVHCLQVHNLEVYILRNNQSYQDIIENPTVSSVLIGPGPGNPDGAGSSLEIIQICIKKKIPLLGVCLGHQCIAQVCGGSIVRAQSVMHGKTSILRHQGEGLFCNIPSLVTVVRYHSLVIDASKVPHNIEILATSEDQEIMAIKVKNYPIYGVQFHPESIHTEYGSELIRNFHSLTS